MPALPSPVPIPWRVHDGGTDTTSEKLPLAWGGGCGGGSLPGVDAVLPAKRVLDGEAAVVELQGGEAALVQAHHLAVAQGGCLGAVPCGMGCLASPRPSPGSTAWWGPGPCAGGPGNGPGRVVPTPALERPPPGDDREVPVPGQWPCISPVPSTAGHAEPARLGSHPDLPHRLWLPAQWLCLLNKEVWIFPTI